MAALQTLRNKPALLMSVIGGALLLFIVTLTDLNSCSRPNVEAEVDGTELTYEVVQNAVANEEEVQSLLLESISEDQKEAIQQQIWQNFLQERIVAKEADKLGLIVTDEDKQNALANVSQQELQQIMQMMQYGQVSLSQVSSAQKIMLLMAKFVGSPTVAAYKDFIKKVDQQINQYKQQSPEAAEMLARLKNACIYLEGNIGKELLAQKYVALMAQGASSNPTTAKMDFDLNSTKLNLTYAAVSYSTIADKEVKVTDDDIKAKYEESKEMFRKYADTRDLKTILVTVTPNQSDRNNIQAQVKAAEDSLRAANTIDQVDNVMRSVKDGSYNKIYLKKDYFTQNNFADVAAAIDSLSVGGVLATSQGTDRMTGKSYFATYKLVATTTTPDSMQVCQFAVNDKALADSLVKAANAGTPLSELAKKHDDMVKKYQQKVDTTWLATTYYLAPTDTTGLNDVCQIPAGKTAYITANDNQGTPVYIVTSVIKTAAPSTKYNVAFVKSEIKFSSKTYNDERAKFGKFLAANKTVDKIVKNANKAGYTVVDRPNISTTDAMTMRLGIGGEGAKSAFMWAFDEAKAGEVSKMYECGKESNTLLVIAVTGINEDDYLAWDSPAVKETLRRLVINEKKAEKILAAAKNVKNINAAKALKGATVEENVDMTISQVAGAEPTFAGALSKTAKGKFTGAVKGVTAVYFAQVNDKTAQGTFNEKTAMLTSAQSVLSQILSRQSNVFDALQHKLKIVDKRYKF